MIASHPLSPWKPVAASIGTLGIAGGIDYLTGAELMVPVLYYAPPTIAAWYFGRGSGILMALLASVMWGIVDKFDGHVYSHTIYRYWNAFMFFLSFSVIAFLVARQKANIELRDRANRELAKTLEDLRQSTADVMNLQRKLHVICAWTKQIREEGRWVPIEEYLAHHLKLSFTHGMSPEAVEGFKRDAEDKEI